MLDIELNIEIAKALGWPVHDWEWTTSPHPLMGRAAHCLVRNYDPLAEEREAARAALPQFMNNNDKRYDAWQVEYAAIYTRYPYPDYRAQHPMDRCIPAQADIAELFVPKYSSNVEALKPIETILHDKNLVFTVDRGAYQEEWRVIWEEFAPEHIRRLKSPVVVWGATEARARAEAALETLKILSE